ncbi:hypothetical protein BDR04DRAFT_1152865 [Suillus decipiens]|nr:hypothetical protein BDR04DRAFT_1152865 [Suillus decipiens]
MTFGEVIHYVTQPTGWPEPVRGIASLLSPSHCSDGPSNDLEHLSSGLSSTFSGPLVSNEAPSAGSYTAKDFQVLIQSTAAGLSTLAELPQYGSERSTVPLWSQLLYALSNTLSPDVMIIEDASFIMPRAQNVASQPLDLIDGCATLLAAHAIFSVPRTHSDTSRTSSQNKEDEDESMRSADSDSIDGSVESLNLPFQAHMLSGRGRRLLAVLPVLLVADSHNIVPLICSALYQRHVWGIRQPVVGLCCSSTGTIAKAIFGWLDSDRSEEGCIAIHLALAADIGLDASMGVFDFTDTRSAISLAQFVLGLRTHFEDIKGAISIEGVDSLTPLRWRSDLPDLETQSEELDERVASWTHQVNVHTRSSEASCLFSPHTLPPLCNGALVSYETMSSPLLGTIVEDKQVHGANIRVPQEANAMDVQGRLGVATIILEEIIKEDKFIDFIAFDAFSDTGLNDNATISNWLFERNAFTVGRIPVNSDGLAKKTGINAMVKIYDEMTAFTWSDNIKAILLDAKVDSFVSDIRSDLCDMNDGPSSQSSANDVLSWEDVEFIASKVSILLHIVNRARQYALLFYFFQPVPDQRDVLLERQLNFARDLAVDDSSFTQRAIEMAHAYETFCNEQFRCVRLTTETSDSWEQAVAARSQAFRFSEDIQRNSLKRNFAQVIAYHSSLDPATGKCDAILVIPCTGVAATMFQHVSSIDKKAKLLKSFMLVQSPKLEKPDASSGKTPRQVETPVGHYEKTKSELQNPFLHHPDGNQAVPTRETILPEDPSCDEHNQQDLLLPVLLAEYKKKDEPAISTAIKTYLVSAVTFLSEFGLTDKPVFGLVVNGTLGAVTMAWKSNNKIYIMERNVRYYDIRDPLQALQFVSILPRFARYGLSLRRALEKQLAVIDVGELQSQPWSKLYQRQEDEGLMAARRTEAQQKITDEAMQ